MARVWKDYEVKLLNAEMGIKRIMAFEDAIRIAKRLPNRTPCAVQRKWHHIQAELRRIHQGGVKYRGEGIPKTPTITISDAHFTNKFVEFPQPKEIRDFLRAKGLRGRVTIELGE